jgi:hypothetical protein
VSEANPNKSFSSYDVPTKVTPVVRKLKLVDSKQVCVEGDAGTTAMGGTSAKEKSLDTPNTSSCSEESDAHP